MSLFVAIWYLSLNQLAAGLLVIALSCDSEAPPAVFEGFLGVPLIVLRLPPLLELASVQSVAAAPRLMPKIEANRMAAGRSSPIVSGATASRVLVLLVLLPLSTAVAALLGN